LPWPWPGQCRKGRQEAGLLPGGTPSGSAWSFRWRTGRASVGWEP
jgi:hypothetical protein